MSQPGQEAVAKIRIAIIDDDALLRAGLRMMLAAAGDLVVVAEAGDGSTVAALVEEHRPAVVLMDIRMPVTDGLRATEELRSRPEAPEVIILTTFDADEHVLRALRAGAAGFLLKDTSPEDLVAAVRRVARGESVLSPSVTRQLIDRVSASDTDQRKRRAIAQLGTLSEREQEIAVAVGRGLSNAETARDLFISIPTVKSHISSVFTKLGLNNRVQIALVVHDAERG